MILIRFLPTCKQLLCDKDNCLMKKILCPVDGSSAADNAVIYSAKLAKKFGARLELFNVQVLADLTPADAVLGKDYNSQAAASRLEQKALEVKQVFKVDCEAKVATGLFSLNSAIREEALDFDLVVMGTQGEDDLNKRLFGSHTYKFIRSSSVPILLIPNGCGYSEISRIAYAFDYWNEHETPMTHVVQLAKSLSSELCVLQVMEQRFTRHAEMQLERTQQHIQSLYADEVKITFDALYSYTPSEGIQVFMNAGRADVMALCSRYGKFFTSVFDHSLTRSISRNASYPVYIFHR